MISRLDIPGITVRSLCFCAYPSVDIHRTTSPLVWRMVSAVGNAMGWILRFLPGNWWWDVRKQPSNMLGSWRLGCWKTMENRLTNKVFHCFWRLRKCGNLRGIKDRTFAWTLSLKCFNVLDACRKWETFALTSIVTVCLNTANLQVCQPSEVQNI